MGYKKQKILIVEDNAVQILVLKQLVKECGHKVIDVVDRGEEAITRVVELEPDLIIMDVFLKGDMTGIEAMQRISRTCKVPAIYISGNSDPFYATKAKRQGCVEFLYKPIKSSDMARAINKGLSNQSGKGKSNRAAWKWPFSLFF